MLTVCVSLALGAAYSADLPLLRWKRSPLLAAGCILAVRAIIVQFGFFAHAQRSLSQSAAAQSVSTSAASGLAATPAALSFAALFFAAFSVVIALLKDVPDARGDALCGIRTLPVRVGQTQVYWGCVTLLSAALSAAAAYTLAGLGGAAGAAGAAAQLALAASLVAVARGGRADQASSVYGVYMHVWRIFYVEYVLMAMTLPFG